MAKRHRYEVYGTESCFYCDGPWENLPGYSTPPLDHFIPRSKGGRNTGNLVPACFYCNNSKGNLSIEEWEAVLNVKLKQLKREKDKIEKIIKAIGKIKVGKKKIPQALPLDLRE